MSALEEVANTADEVAADHRSVARHARQMQRQRDRGWSWTRILDEQRPPGLLELLRRAGQRTSKVTSSVSVSLAAALSAEGHSHRQIARRLGVTHQRVSAMLNGSRRRTEA